MTDMMKTMMMKQKTLTTAARAAAACASAALLVAALTGCSEAIEPQLALPQAGTPVTLTVTDAQELAGFTRAGTAVNNDVSALNGQRLLAIFRPQGAVNRDAAVFSVGAAGATTAETDASHGQEPLYVTGATATDAITVEAYMPFGTANASSQGTKLLTRPYSWSVLRDQTGDDGYQASDLMVGSATLNSSGAATVSLEHRMSKVVISTKNTATTTHSSAVFRQLQVISGYRTCRLDYGGTMLAEPTLQYADAIDATDANMVKLYGNDTGATTVAQACLLPPQTLAAGDAFRLVMDEGGNTFTFTVRLADVKTLRTGETYTLNVNVDDLFFAQADANSGAATITVSGWQRTQNVTVGNAPAVQNPNNNGYYQVGGTMFRMVPVEPGTATNGNSYTGNKFWMGETEVTSALWAEVNGSHSALTTPATSIKKSAMLEWIGKLNAQTAAQRPPGYLFCLPTLEQWQFAAHGGVHSKGYTYCGSNTVDDVSWYNANATQVPGVTTDNLKQPVARKQPNELSLYDMSGNVCEVVSDPGSGTSPVKCCGGSWYDPETSSEWTHNVNVSDAGKTWLGFRLCLKPVTVGDLYYSDGSWGPMAENPGKTPVGIVFHVGTSAADQEKGYYGGYVMALKTANNNNSLANWSSSSAQVTDALFNSTDQAAQWAALTGDMDGLTHCLTAKDGNGNTYDDLTAMKAADDYNATVSVPVSTSGWYLPSIGQIYCWLKAFGSDAELTDMSKWSWRSSYTDFYTTANKANTVVDNINAYLTGKGLTADTDFTPLSKTTYTGDATDYVQYVSSTEQSAERVFYCTFVPNGRIYMVCDGGKTHTYFRVRPVLAF